MSLGDKISTVVTGRDADAEGVVRRSSCSAWACLSGLGVAVFYLFYMGTGIWGINQPVAWGFAIVNFVWWIGIGHAGTLISAILLLLAPEVADQHQPLRRGDDHLRGELRRASSR